MVRGVGRASAAAAEPVAAISPDAASPATWTNSRLFASLVMIAPRRLCRSPWFIPPQLIHARHIPVPPRQHLVDHRLASEIVRHDLHIVRQVGVLACERAAK